MTAAERPVRWGILSTASITSQLVPAIREAGAEVVAVASRDHGRAEEHARQHGIGRAYGSYAELYADANVEVVYVATPNALHAECTAQALAAGKHVLCEKPMTLTAAEAEELFALADRSGLRLMEAFMYRHHPQTHRLKELARDGTIGELHSIHASFHFKVADPGSDHRYSRTLGGGALRDVGGYCISAATYVLDAEPDRIHGVARTASSGVDERTFGLLEFDDGVVVTVDCSLDTEMVSRVTVLGSDGRVWVDNPFLPDALWVWGDSAPPMEIYVGRGAAITTIPSVDRSTYVLEAEGFSRAVRGHGAQEVSPEETLRNLRISDRLREATWSEPSGRR
jgi:D-xylose 1-dehydrogenase (NADP+, D-xylono-1,5-lactone-forming)